jgi:hypothetical protein
MMPVRVMLSYGTEGKTASDTEGNNGQGREALTATVVVFDASRKEDAITCPLSASPPPCLGATTTTISL